MPRRTVLEPLRSLRRQQVEKQIGRLVQQVARRQDAEARARALREELEHASSVTASVSNDLTLRLTAGELRAHELGQAQRWLSEARQREREALAQQRTADSSAEAERIALRQERQALAEARGAAQAVGERHDRRRRECARRRISRCEQETLDDWAAGERRVGRRGPGRPGSGE